jgi:muconolactone D-isomerase
VEFLVEIRGLMPADVDPELAADVGRREGVRGRELVDAGTIRQIWRIPGRRDNVGIWEAPDAEALHAAISSLPAFPWQDVTVRPLAPHPLAEAIAARSTPTKDSPS